MIYRLTSQQVPPLVRETRIVSRITQPVDYSRYEEPTWKRSPPYVSHATERWQRIARAENVCWFHKRQAE